MVLTAGATVAAALIVGVGGAVLGARAAADREYQQVLRAQMVEAGVAFVNAVRSVVGFLIGRDLTLETQSPKDVEELAARSAVVTERLALIDFMFHPDSPAAREALRCRAYAETIFLNLALAEQRRRLDDNGSSSYRAACEADYARQRLEISLSQFARLAWDALAEPNRRWGDQGKVVIHYGRLSEEELTRARRIAHTQAVEDEAV
jgi:hypothetical protein